MYEDAEQNNSYSTKITHYIIPQMSIAHDYQVSIPTIF